MRRLSVSLALVGLLTLTLVGCSGGSEELKVGAIMDLTGDLGEYGAAMDKGIKLAADQLVAAGAGTISVTTEDGGTSDTIAVEAARGLVNVTGVSAIIGPLASGITAAVANAVTVPGGILEITTSGTAPSLTALEDNDLLFRTAPSDAFQGVVLANLATELGYKTAGVMYVNNAYGQGLSDQFAASFAANGGTVTALVPHESVQATYASEVQRVTANNPDVLVAISYPESAAVYLREAVDSGKAKKFLLTDGTKSEELISKVGASALEGAQGTAPSSVDSASSAQFAADFQATYGTGLTGPFIAESYDAMVLIGLAYVKAGSANPTEIRNALREVANAPGEIIGAGESEIRRAIQLIRDGKDINYQGASGPVDFDANGDVAGAMEIWKVESGKTVRVKVIAE
ncbi:MAG: ABC transporter substrate-binding protein [Chloroflexota bacterium]